MEISVERPVAGGRMLARHQGQIVLVSGAIPGERVRVRVERATRSVVWAETTEVLEPSADRRTPVCDPACGGALYAHVRYPRQLLLKGEVIADALHRIGKIDRPPPSVAASPQAGYRLRARLHVRGRHVGFFREGSHVVCDPAPTGQLHPEAATALNALADGLGSSLAWCDGIVVSENVPATQRVLHLLPRPGCRLDALRLSVDRLPGVSGITVEAPLDETVTIDGHPAVTETAEELFGGKPPFAAPAVWTRGPASFFQANRFLIGDLVRRVLAAAPAESCVDLYAGVGLFAVALAAQGRCVTAVEGDVNGARDLLLNAAPWAHRVRVAHAAVEGFVRRFDGPRPGVVVLDPPRSGASGEALEGLVQWAPARVVYVSCDPPTLARDAARLVAAGYRLEALDAFDLFPNTPHVEMVAVFDRA